MAGLTNIHNAVCISYSKESSRGGTRASRARSDGVNPKNTRGESCAHLTHKRVPWPPSAESYGEHTTRGCWLQTLQCRGMTTSRPYQIVLLIEDWWNAATTILNIVNKLQPIASAANEVTVATRFVTVLGATQSALLKGLNSTQVIARNIPCYQYRVWCKKGSVGEEVINTHRCPILLHKLKNEKQIDG